MRRNLIYICVVLLPLCSCKGFLEPYPSGIRSQEYVLSNPKTLEGLVGRCYDYLSSNYDDEEGALLDCLTDNAVRTDRSNVMSLIASGVTNPANDPFETWWKRDYDAIYNLNLFLKDGKGRNVRYLSDSHRNELLVKRLWGEAYGLRAWFQWDLLQKFGGRSSDGTLLGFPILKEPLDIGSLSTEELDDFSMKRNTYDECVQQILADCDSAFAYLPLAHRDFLVSDQTDLTILGALNWGRIDGISTRAIKALVYLTWASPRFNPQGDVSRWENAAHYAKEVIDFKMSVDKVSDGFKLSGNENWFNPNDPGIIWSLYTSGSTSMEKMFWPGSFQGSGKMGATQSLVDDFPMADGYPVGESPTYAYDPQDPYKNRDPRFYSTIFYNDRTVKVGSKKQEFTFQMYEGGKDASGEAISNTLTNYYIKKFVYMGYNLSESDRNTAAHYKAFLRWTDMVLCFAEAANRVNGPLVPFEGLTPKEAIGWLRSRKTLDGDPMYETDPYLDYISLCGKDEFDRFLRKERRIETCFEGKRFFDLRRWSTTLGCLNTTVTRPVIKRDQDGHFTYTYGETVDKRVFTSAYLPIPYKEMRKNKGLEQNEGWDNWQ